MPWVNRFVTFCHILSYFVPFALRATCEWQFAADRCALGWNAKDVKLFGLGKSVGRNILCSTGRGLISTTKLGPQVIRIQSPCLGQCEVLWGNCSGG